MEDLERKQYENEHRQDLHELECKNYRENNGREHNEIRADIDEIKVQIGDLVITVRNLSDHGMKVKSKIVDKSVIWLVMLLATFIGNGILFYLNSFVGRTP